MTAIEVEQEQPLGEARLVRVDDLPAQELVADRDDFRVHFEPLRRVPESSVPKDSGPIPFARFP